MTPKIGDHVRFLNSVGGGVVKKIEGQIAYVDEDGFETPVLLRECVVVAQGDGFYKSSIKRSVPEPAPKAEPVKSKDATPAPAPSRPAQVLPPVEETPEGEDITLVLGFEPADIKRLSDTSFDAVLVNDSNYGMYVSVATRPRESRQWTLRYAGYIEPQIQEFLFELTPADLPDIDRIALQAVPFKRTASYELREPIAFEQRLDATKFARLHCFGPNPYFDGQVLAVDVVKRGTVQTPVAVDPDQLRKAMVEKVRTDHKPATPTKPKAKHDNAPLEVDLHAGSLLDTLNGLSKADILNYQIDTFRRVMDENLGNIGRRIVFIHGKGEGVLRQALMKELNHRYKGHDVADASFREYGFGATQVTIKSIKN